MAYLGNAPARSFISFEKQVFTIVNSQTAYTLSNSVTNENDIRLVINNVVQEPGAGKAYTASGTTLTLSAALTNGTDEMYCVFLGKAVGTVNAPAGSVAASQLAADSVTAAKLNDDIISGQTALASEPADTDEFLVSDAGTLKRLDYSLIKSSPGLTKLSTITLSSATTLITFDSSIITSTYDAYYFTILASPENDNDYLQVRLSDGGSFNSGSSDYGWAYINDSGSGTSSNGAAQIRLFDATDNSFANAYHGELTLLYPSNSSTKTVVNFKGHRNDGDPALMNGGGQRLNAEATDGIQFFFSTGDASIGSSITCYGITK